MMRRVPLHPNFGKDKRWGYFPSLSARWNISDEYFFRPLKKYISMFSFAPGWGMTGNSPSTNSIMFNKYSQGNSYGSHSTIYPANLRLTDVRWEKTSSWNLGFNVNFLEDLACFNFNIYRKHTTDLLQKSVSIPTSTGYSSLDYKNVGTMDNYGWDLNAYTKPIFKIGKFSMKLKFNAAQNRNRIKEMDASVLAGLNGDFTYKNATASKSGGPGGYEGYLSRVQVGNALYSIYGFRYLGVYRYDYDHCGYFLLLLVMLTAISYMMAKAILSVCTLIMVQLTISSAVVMPFMKISTMMVKLMRWI